MMMLAAVVFAVALLALVLTWPAPGRSAKSVVEVPDTAACRAAVHEIGHTVAAWSCSLVKSVDRVTISSGGGETSFTTRACSVDDASWCMLVIHLAGPAAEAMVYRTWKSLSASGDLREARICASRIVAESIEPPWQEPADGCVLSFDRAFSKTMSPKELAVMRRAYAEARRVVKAHEACCYRLVGLLLHRQRLGENDLASHLPPRVGLQVLGTIQGRFVV